MKKARSKHLTKWQLNMWMFIISTLISVLMLATSALAEQTQFEQSQIEQSQIEKQQIELFQSQRIIDGGRVVTGGNIESQEKVNGDAVAIVGNVSLSDGARGDAVAILGNIRAKGNFNGDVVSIGGNINLEGEVNGDVVAIGGKIILKNGTVVNGDIVGSSIEKAADVQVGGEIVQLPVPVLNLAGKAPGIANVDFSQLNAIFFGLKIVGTIITLLILMGVLALYPQGVAKIEDSLQRDTWRVLLIGFVTSLLIFPVLLTVIGIPIVLILVLAAKFLGYAGVLMVIAKKLQETVKLKGMNPYLQVFVALVLMFFISYIPILGFVIKLVVIWFTLGAVIDTKFGTGKPWFNSQIQG